MNPQTLKYLQNDEVGKVIATGLATLYMNKPQKPIKYLAEWLKTYSHNEK